MLFPVAFDVEAVRIVEDRRVAITGRKQGKNSLSLADGLRIGDQFAPLVREGAEAQLALPIICAVVSKPAPNRPIATVTISRAVS